MLQSQYYFFVCSHSSFTVHRSPFTVHLILQVHSQYFCILYQAVFFNKPFLVTSFKWKNWKSFFSHIANWFEWEKWIRQVEKSDQYHKNNDCKILPMLPIYYVVRTVEVKRNNEMREAVKIENFANNRIYLVQKTLIWSMELIVPLFKL